MFYFVLFHIISHRLVAFQKVRLSQNFSGPQFGLAWLILAWRGSASSLRRRAQRVVVFTSFHKRRLTPYDRHVSKHVPCKNIEPGKTRVIQSHQNERAKMYAFEFLLAISRLSTLSHGPHFRRLTRPAHACIRLGEA
ncbi:hypothetical protein EDB85DRAFT_1965342 [Lactarius pseudohatsudake]|nr:hypothetical protein EDB85DRAFT_1965342 [Lactarius pseudohatsudake]